MRPSAALLTVVSPLAALLHFWLSPDADRAIVIPLIHFYIVTFTTFKAATVSILLAFPLGTLAKAGHMLAAIGVLFFSHGFATPGARFQEFSPGGGSTFIFWIPK